jgi:hypothetical protein
MSETPSMNTPTKLGLVISSLWALAILLCAYQRHHGRLLVALFISLVLVQAAFFLSARTVSLLFRHGFLISIAFCEVLALAIFLYVCFHRSSQEVSSIELASVSIAPGAQVSVSSTNKLVLRLGAEDILPTGPLSFDVDPHGTSYVSDSEGRKILAFDDKGSVRKSLPLPFQPGRILIQNDDSFFLVDAVTGKQYELDSNGSGAHELINGDNIEAGAPQTALKILSTDSFSACEKTGSPSPLCTYKFSYSGKELVGLSFLGSLSDHHGVCFDLQVAEHNRPATVLRFVAIYDEHGSLITTIGPLFNGYDYPLTDDLRVRNDRLYQLRISDKHVYMDRWSLP